MTNEEQFKKAAIAFYELDKVQKENAEKQRQFDMRQQLSKLAENLQREFGVGNLQDFYTHPVLEICGYLFSTYGNDQLVFTARKGVETKEMLVNQQASKSEWLLKLGKIIELFPNPKEIEYMYFKNS